MFWYCYSYDPPDIILTAAARVTLTLHSFLPDIPMSLPSPSDGYYVPSLAHIPSNQAQHREMHVVHINNTHVTYNGKVEKYYEIQANCSG